LISGFLKSVDRFPSHTALVIDGEAFTYLALYRAASRIASAIIRHEQGFFPLAGMLAHRSLTAYASVLGILATGKGYVPLNPKFPTERTRRMLLLSGCTVLVAGNESLGQLPGLLSEVTQPLTVILPDVSDLGNLPVCLPLHRFVTSTDMSGGDFSPDPETKPTDIAYLLFTSGSTGEPKGVPISQSNVCSYVRSTRERYDLNEGDRFSQSFELTFDLSVHDLFLCWGRGGSLFCLPEESLVAPAAFIRKHGLTVWFSVPSVIGVLAKLRLLQPDCFPSLKYTLFCGEPLSATYAQLWQEAAPNSVLENLYGPTEATIAIACYRWNQATSPQECLNGIVPLGQIFTGQRLRIIDRERNIVGAGDSGELCLSGSQVSSGYWNDSNKTEERFIRLVDTERDWWYRTGDLVKQDESGCLHYVGRIDHQVKIRGYRVELQEIEAVLRTACAANEVVSVPWPVKDGSAAGVAAFVSGVQAVDRDSVQAYCRRFLPDYMIPRNIYVLDFMPLNLNGKVDRTRLLSLLEEADAEANAERLHQYCSSLG
jgi:amino acid adenylation domain-containing protein